MSLLLLQQPTELSVDDACSFSAMTSHSTQCPASSSDLAQCPLCIFSGASGTLCFNLTRGGCMGFTKHFLCPRRHDVRTKTMTSSQPKLVLHLSLLCSAARTSHHNDLLFHPFLPSTPFIFSALRSPAFLESLPKRPLLPSSQPHAECHTLPEQDILRRSM